MGVLHPHRRRRGDKHFQTWRFKTSLGDIAEIEVRVQGYTFRAECEEPPFKFENTDLGKLRQEVEAKIRGYSPKAWKKKIHVRIMRFDYDGDADDRGMLEIRFTVFEENTGLDGNPIYREPGKTYLHHCDFEVSSDRMVDASTDEVKAIIPWTQETEDRLRQIVDALKALGGRVMDLMHPAKIERTLQHANKLLLSDTFGGKKGP